LSRLRSRQQALGALRGARETALFAQVSAFAACVPLLLRLPLPRLAALLNYGTKRSPPRYEKAERLPELVRLAHQAWRPLVRSGCLTRGVTLFWFLRRAGLNVELCFGMDPRGDEPDGHCWLVRDGEVFLERVDPRARFAETYRLPAPRQ
jgi:hypothetical protein